MSWYHNTLFVLTADHTGPIADERYKTDVSRFAIPIIYFQPSDSTLVGINDSTITQQIDIFPSVLNYLRFTGKFVSFGKSVFDKKAERFAINFLNGVYQIIKGDYVLLFDGEKTIGLYNFKSDKSLKMNLQSKHPEIVSEYEKQIKAIIQQYNNRLINNKVSEE